MDYELIKYNENLPFKVIILNTESQPYHWHKEMELIFLLKGTVVFEVKEKKYKISEKDLFFINSFDIHSVTPEKGENIMLILQFDPIFFDEYCPEFSSFYYEPNNTLGDKSNQLYNKISMNLAELMISIIKLNTGYKLKALNSVIEIALILIQNFRTEKQIENTGEFYKQKRISDILKFIEDNYAYDISLNSLAEKVAVSPQYISKFFKNALGISFVDYVNKLRINKSLNALLSTKKSIIDISIEHGFNDHKAYNRVFKKHFNMTATEYRNNHSRNKILETSEKLSDSYFDDNSSNYFKYLFEFLQTNKNEIRNESNISDKLNLNIDFTKAHGKKLKKYWNKITSVGRAALCLRQEVQTQIRTAQKEIGFEYIRFHGIFSDELMVYREDGSGNPLYNWNYIDSIFDFFYEINLKPFIEIGFMPEALASKKQYNPFVWKANVSYPKSLKKWGNLVSEFIKHCIERYGKDEVEKWYFEIWSAPEISNVFWYESQKSFFEFYKETYFSIKKFSSNLKVGSPGVLPINDFQWFDDFLNYCKNNSIVLDFGASHIYTYTDPQNETLPAEFLHSSIARLSLSDKDFLEDTILSLKKKLQNNHVNNMKLFVTEWNLSPFTKDYNRDTCFLSTFIIYNILNNIGNIDGLVFWSLSDIIEEGLTENKLFHGGLGLFTFNGIKKSPYNAFFLLNKLGDTIIEMGEDYIVTSKNNNYQILIYNYVYFDELFRTGDKSLLSYHNRYSIFETTKQNKTVNIILSLESGDYRIKRFALNREAGSSFDAWLKMGAPEIIQPDIYSFLKSKESPEITIATESVKKQLILNEFVPVHGISLIEINKI